MQVSDQTAERRNHRTIIFNSREGQGGSLGARAYDLIYQKIVVMEYQPGAVLLEKELMADLSMGRTPIREAIQRLSAEGVIEMHPHKVTMVRPITIQGTKALFAALGVLEQAVAKAVLYQGSTRGLERMEEAQEEMRLAVAQGEVADIVSCNQAFHHAFHHASDNFYLIHALKPVTFEMERLSHISFRHGLLPHQPVETVFGMVLREHDQILECIRNQKPEELSRAITEHHATFRKRIINYLTD